MRIVLRAKLVMLKPNNGIIKSKFDVESNVPSLGEYVIANLHRERGDLIEGRFYEVSFIPLFPTLKG